jgi:multidrug resistance efflux pump
MVNKEEIYNTFGLKESDLKLIESPNKATIELQLKIFKENYLGKLVISNG